jgi:hypothetical protein
MTLDFTPTVYPYLTWVPGRNPYQKTHDSLGQAKKAILFRLTVNGLAENCRVYKWQDNKWKLLWDIPEGTQREDMPWL